MARGAGGAVQGARGGRPGCSAGCSGVAEGAGRDDTLTRGSSVHLARAFLYKRVPHEKRKRYKDVLQDFYIFLSGTPLF